MNPTMDWYAAPYVVFDILLYVFVSPLVLGSLRWVRARLQGRRGPWPLQPYLDLWKLIRRRTLFPASASFVYKAAPGTVFVCMVLAGLLLPINFLPPLNPADQPMHPWPIADLVVLIYLLGMARFAIGLAGMDSGSPFGELGSSREMFIHFLAEPALILVAFALALRWGSTSLVQVLLACRKEGLELYLQASLWLILIALWLAAIAETGRIPIDNPATHLELTMTGRAVWLEYAGRHLGLLEWAEAMRLTFFLTLLINLTLPGLLVVAEGVNELKVFMILLYPLKLMVLVLGLALWELARAKLRLRAVAAPASMAMLFACLAIVISIFEKMVQ